MNFYFNRSCNTIILKLADMLVRLWGLRFLLKVAIQKKGKMVLFQLCPPPLKIGYKILKCTKDLFLCVGFFAKHKVRIVIEI